MSCLTPEERLLKSRFMLLPSNNSNNINNNINSNNINRPHTLLSNSYSYGNTHQNHINMNNSYNNHNNNNMSTLFY